MRVYSALNDVYRERKDLWNDLIYERSILFQYYIFYSKTIPSSSAKLRPFVAACFYWKNISSMHTIYFNAADVSYCDTFANVSYTMFSLYLFFFFIKFKRTVTTVKEDNIHVIKSKL